MIPYDTTVTQMASLAPCHDGIFSTAFRGRLVLPSEMLSTSCNQLMNNGAFQRKDACRQETVHQLLAWSTRGNILCPSQREGGQLGRPGLKAVEKLHGARERQGSEEKWADCSLFRQWPRFRGRQLGLLLRSYT